MQVTTPLSLKVSLWLLLNLLLLAAAVVGFFVVRGGVGWDALLAGPTGDHVQSKANVIAGEIATATAENRSAVLARYAAEHRADFFLLRGEEIVLSTAQADLPEGVRSRTEFRLLRKAPSSQRNERGDAAATADGPRPTPPAEAEPVRRPENVDQASARLELFTYDPKRERDRSRFIVRAESPNSYWVGMRVPPFMGMERGRFRGPVTLVARIDSLPGLLRYLELQSWFYAGTAAMALSVLFWLPLVRSITRSIGQLTRATEQIAKGHFDTRVDTGRRDELGLLGDSVNRMAERLDAYMNGQKRFLGDVAHELCSPLARLQMATGILTDQAPANLKDSVSDLREEVQQMSTLVNELLAFTKAGLKPRDVVCMPVELEPLAREVLEREDAASATLRIASDVRVYAERDLLARALGNLVRNAVRYAGTGTISIEASRDAAQVVIAVEDEGPGVPAADLDRLGEPFFRPELARTREGGGVGLGLAIVRQSIGACGGQVRFSNRTPRGFRAEIRLRAA